MNCQKLEITPENILIKLGKVTDCLIEWLVPNLSQVSRGDKLVTILLSVQQGKYQYEKQVELKAEINGLCIHKDNCDKIKAENILGSTIGTVYGDIEDYLSVKFPNVTHKIVDSFTDENIFTWTKLAGYTMSGIPIEGKDLKFYIRSIYKEGKFFLTFVFNCKLKKGDTISLRFNDGSILDFTIAGRPHKLSDDYILRDENYWQNYWHSVLSKSDALEHCDAFEYCDAHDYALEHCYSIKRMDAREVEFQLSSTELFTFSKSLLIEYRFTFNSEGGISKQGGFENPTIENGMCPCVIRNMFIKLLKAAEWNVSSFDSSSIAPSLTSLPQECEFDYCYVYLMHDEANGYYKIGMSNDPTYREGTLQSEKPTIKLVASHKYPSRKIASAIEAALHNVYKDNHVRGEWYRLDANDVLAIKETLE